MSISADDPSTADPGRRRFLAAALALAAGGLLPATLQAAGADVTARLTSALSDPTSASRLGRAYLAAHPEEADSEALAQRLEQALEARGAPAGDRDELIAGLNVLVQDEYVTAPLVSVDGWLLAQSEARLYALAALAHGPADLP